MLVQKRLSGKNVPKRAGIWKFRVLLLLKRKGCGREVGVEEGTEYARMLDGCVM